MQGCDQFHQAKDGDGWVETRFSSSIKVHLCLAFTIYYMEELTNIVDFCNLTAENLYEWFQTNGVT